MRRGLNNFDKLYTVRITRKVKRRYLIASAARLIFCMVGFVAPFGELIQEADRFVEIDNRKQGLVM